MNQGELVNFKLQSFLDVINEFVRADELERALWVTKNLPAYYRDFPPKEIVDLNNKIVSRIATPTVYANSKFDANVDFDDRTNTSKTLRGQLISLEVEFFNQKCLVPHIIDYGPGEYWLPFLLKKKGLKFTYQAIYLATEAHEIASKQLKDEMIEKADGSPNIFVACEIIEHLWNEEDLKTEMLKSVGLADIIHISTPRYTCDAGCLDWDASKPELGHLRAYTPNEFVNKLHTMFPEYQYQFFNSFIMHMRLVKKGLPSELINLFAGAQIQELK